MRQRKYLHGSSLKSSPGLFLQHRGPLSPISGIESVSELSELCTKLFQGIPPPFIKILQLLGILKSFLLHNQTPPGWKSETYFGGLWLGWGYDKECTGRVGETQCSDIIVSKSMTFESLYRP